jgi:hypothetical protein
VHGERFGELFYEVDGGLLQVMMFSATLHSDEVKQMAARICQNPILVDMKVRPPFIPLMKHWEAAGGSGWCCHQSPSIRFLLSFLAISGMTRQVGCELR